MTIERYLHCYLFTALVGINLLQSAFPNDDFSAQGRSGPRRKVEGWRGHSEALSMRAKVRKGNRFFKRRPRC
jgi:hypothetical protein